MLQRRWFDDAAIGLIAALAVAGIACNEKAALPIESGMGPAPNLPAPKKSLLPTVNIAPARGWPQDGKPSPAPASVPSTVPRPPLKLPPPMTTAAINRNSMPVPAVGLAAAFTGGHALAQPPEQVLAEPVSAANR